MRRYLYRINSEGAVRDYMEAAREYPIMPRVLAEKTAKELRKQAQRRWGRVSGWDKYRAYKTGVPTVDGSPKGLKQWSFAWQLGFDKEV